MSPSDLEEKSPGENSIGFNLIFIESQFLPFLSHHGGGKLIAFGRGLDYNFPLRFLSPRGRRRLFHHLNGDENEFNSFFPF